MGDSFSRRLGSEDALKMAAEAGAARLEAPMSAATTRLENSSSALGDQIGEALKEALGKAAMTVGGCILLGTGSMMLGCIGGSMLLGVALTMSYVSSRAAW